MFNLTNNPRAIISMESLAESYYTLLKDKCYSDITIDEICIKAGVTRKTFYRNFETKDDLFDYYIYQTIMVYYASPAGLTPRQYLINFFTEFSKDKEMLRICMRNNLFSLLLDQLTKYMELNESFSSLIRTKEEISSFSRYFWPVVNEIQVMMLKVWTAGGFKETPEELAEIFIKIETKLGVMNYNKRQD